MKLPAILPLVGVLIFGLSVVSELRAESFTTTGPMATARTGHSATLLLDGRVLVAGGGSGNQDAFDSAELFDPATGTWTRTGSMTVARTTHVAVLLPDGKVLVVGGRGNGNIRLASAELYDPARGAWTNTGALNIPRLSFTASLLPNGQVLVAGGYGDAGKVGTTELYDPATGLWTTNSVMAIARDGHTATLLPSGKLLVTGGNGFVPPYYVVLANAEIYDPVAGTWASNSVMGTMRQGHKATLLADGKLLVTGAGKSEAYDPATSTWGSMASFSAGFDSFEYCPPVLLPSGKVLIAGGNYYNFSGGGLSIYFNTSRLYDPVAGTWATNAPLQTARYQHTATLLADGRVLVAGGSGSAGPLASAELYGSANVGPTPVLLTQPAKPANGPFQFAFAGTAGGTNTVLTTTNVADPLNAWTLLGAATEVSPGQFQFSDPQAQNNPQRFYRVRTP